MLTSETVTTINVCQLIRMGRVAGGETECRCVATIKDVARAAGVSVSTVSRVINDSGYVHEDTAVRVRRALSQLQFTPSHLARGLVSGRTATVGLVVPDVANPFFADVARGTEDAAIAHKFSMMLCNTDWKPEQEQMYLEVLRSKRVDGVIVVGSRSPAQALMKSIGTLAHVLVEQTGSGRSSVVWADNERGGALATKHLLDTGCRRLVHITGPENSPSALARYRGFMQATTALKAHGSELQTLILPGDFRYEGGFQAGSQLFDTDFLADGVFAGNDLMAIGFIQAVKSRGMRVPKDISVIGYDNIAMAQYIAPRLTTIDQPSYDMGYAAFEMLYSQLQKSLEQPDSRKFDPVLVSRESTRSS